MFVTPVVWSTVRNEKCLYGFTMRNWSDDLCTISRGSTISKHFASLKKKIQYIISVYVFPSHLNFKSIFNNLEHNSCISVGFPILKAHISRSILLSGPIEPFYSIANALIMEGARCSSVVRVFTHGVMGHRIDPSWLTMSYFLFQPVFHNWCNKGCGLLSCPWDDAYWKNPCC